MNLAHIDELDAIELQDGFVWRPVRRRFGIQAFGINAYTPGASGQVVEEHTERSLRARGDLPRPARTRPLHRRRQRARARPRAARLRPRPVAPPRRRRAHGRRGGARDRRQAGRAARGLGMGVHVRRLPAPPRRPLRRGETAAARGTGGEARRARRSSTTSHASRRSPARSDTALELLNEAVAGDESFRKYAQTDEDFASIRDDPALPALAGRPGGARPRREHAAPAPGRPPAARRGARRRGPPRARASRRAAAARARARTPCAPARRRTGRAPPPARAPRRRRPTSRRPSRRRRRPGRRR